MVAWSSSWAGPTADGRACSAGDKPCLVGAFYKAYLLLDAPSVRHIVAGRVVAAEGLPGALLDADHEFENVLAGLGRHELSIGTIEGRSAATFDTDDVDVDARLRVRNVLKPYPRCPHPPRVEDAARCERVDALPDELTLRIPSDWFLWPATGTSRRVARRAGQHFKALRQLDRERDAGEIADAEHAQEKRKLESRIRRALERVAVEFKVADRNGTKSWAKHFPKAIMSQGQPARLLEDRQGRIEVGGEYLFALGQREEDAVQTFYRPRKPDHMSGEWHVFWGDEARDVELAMMLIANCARREPPLFTREHLLHGCMYYARGLATFWLYPNFKWRL